MSELIELSIFVKKIAWLYKICLLNFVSDKNCQTKNVYDKKCQSFRIHILSIGGCTLATAMITLAETSWKHRYFLLHATEYFINRRVPTWYCAKCWGRNRLKTGIFRSMQLSIFQHEGKRTRKNSTGFCPWYWPACPAIVLSKWATFPWRAGLVNLNWCSPGASSHLARLSPLKNRPEVRVFVDLVEFHPNSYKKAWLYKICLLNFVSDKNCRKKNVYDKKCQSLQLYILSIGGCPLATALITSAGTSWKHRYFLRYTT